VNQSFFSVLLSHHVHLCHLDRINKRGSQKDMEQKKSGNYFFYEANDDDGAEEEDFDDL
jgi:hypothetical protein